MDVSGPMFFRLVHGRVLVRPNVTNTGINTDRVLTTRFQFNHVRRNDPKLRSYYDDMTAIIIVQEPRDIVSFCSLYHSR